ncbi:MAG TPA: DMT family transporter [Actinomycetota bacterium]|nr:DMT family transporter [Actinomycetota bacterium]
MSAQAPVATRLSAFSARDWLLLATAALMWGSSFVWMEVALEHLAPGFIAFVRILFGIATLALFPQARRKVERGDASKVVALGFLWMGIPFLLFPIAQQWIDSSLAGMINGGVPIFAAATAALMMRRTPPPMTLVGIGVGFVGTVAIGLPAVRDAEATRLGVALVLLATLMYGISLNIAAPLQRKYGALPVLLRVQLVAAGVTLVPGIVGLAGSDMDLLSLAAVVPLGCFGSALAFVAMTTLVGRVGAARGSVTIYFVPIVAITMGVVFRNESVALLSLLGTALVLLGAFLTSRSQTIRGGGNGQD